MSSNKSPSSQSSAQPVDGYSSEPSGYLLKSRIFSALSGNAGADPSQSWTSSLGWRLMARGQGAGLVTPEHPAQGEIKFLKGK